ncbi:hypothetical protein EJ08DRAFT_570666, partial [Tothia fuscella]
CPVTLDGRVPPFVQPTDFDKKDNTPYGGIRPRSIKWSQILKFPPIQPSLFDLEYGGKPMEIIINQDSINRPPNAGAKTGYRRSELVFAQNSGDDESARGVKTYHWSVRQGRGLNFTHEYQNVWHERKDSKANQFSVHIGALVGREKQINSRFWKVIDQKEQVIWTSPMDPVEWENFAITLDYERNTIQVFYSKAYQRLKPVTAIRSNHNDNGGQFHIGVLKKSTRAKDPEKDGYQELGFQESQIYGGIFIEDSRSGCISM